MNYKKILFGLLAVMMISAISISCKKENNKPFTDTLSNTTWVGTYDNTHDYTFQFGENGKVTVTDGLLSEADARKGTGTYTIAGNVVLITYTYSDIQETLSLSGVLNNDTIEGTYGAGANTSGVGTFSVTKQ